MFPALAIVLSFRNPVSFGSRYHYTAQPPHVGLQHYHPISQYIRLLFFFNASFINLSFNPSYIAFHIIISSCFLVNLSDRVKIFSLFELMFLLRELEYCFSWTIITRISTTSFCIYLKFRCFFAIADAWRVYIYFKIPSWYIIL